MKKRNLKVGRRPWSWADRVPVKVLRIVEKEHDRGASYGFLQKILGEYRHAVSVSAIGRWSVRRRQTAAASRAVGVVSRTDAQIIVTDIVGLLLDRGLVARVRR